MYNWEDITNTPHTCWIMNGCREPHWPSPSWMCCMWISTQFWNICWFCGLRRARISSIDPWRTFTSYALRSASDKLWKSTGKSEKSHPANVHESHNGTNQRSYELRNYITSSWDGCLKGTIIFTHRHICLHELSAQAAMTISHIKTGVHGQHHIYSNTVCPLIKWTPQFL